MTDELRLFLVEDNDEVALLMRKCLERAGCHVTRCRTAADALIVLADDTFDLVLLDQGLPDRTGTELLHDFAAEDITAPVLIVTVNRDDVEAATTALRAGARDYIVKDAGLRFLDELPQRVRESVTRHRLEQNNRLLAQALDSARDGFMITDLQGTILNVNKALEDMTGYGRAELLGGNPRLLKAPATPPEVFAQLWQTVLARNSWQGELTNRRKDGKTFLASITVSPIVDGHGRLTHFVGILRDITERRELERQLLQALKMQSVGTLAGGVAHEFNNLMAGILGYASLGLREAGLSPEVREFLGHVVELTNRAAGLTRQLLAFARKPAMTRQRTPLAELVQATADLMARTLHHEVRVELPAPGADGGPLEVDGDANQLQQALVNLALNARDAVLEREAALPPEPNGMPALYRPPLAFRLTAAPLARARPGFPHTVPPGDYALVEVADEGAGMPADVLTQAVDPFFTTKEQGKGTGLGLSMVFGIVQGHHGFMTIESAAGRGTAVGLYLPRLTDKQPARPPTPFPLRPEVLQPDAGDGRAILVIDDEEAILNVVKKFLVIAGHEVTCADSGRRALELLDAGRRVDLIILDLMMPREDAVTNFHRLRERRPGVPVLLCTGLPQTDTALELESQDRVRLIRKPFRMNELWYAVRSALGDGES